MLRNCLICIFSLCLLQVTQARAPADVADTPSSDECQYMIEIDKYRMWGNSLKISRKLFTATLKELNALPEKSEALHANITRLSDYVDVATHVDNPFDLFALFNEFDDIMEDYKRMPEGDELTETLKAAFEKSDLKKYQSEHEDDLDAFFDFLINMCKDYFDRFLRGDDGFRLMYENHIKSKSDKLDKN